MELLEILNKVEADLRLEEKAEDGVIGRLQYVFILGDKENANKRRHGSDLLSRAISDFREGLKEKNVAGQLNHPLVGKHTELDKISHVITDIQWDEKGKKGIATSAILNTSKGRDLKVLIDNNVPLGASVRGSGQVDENGDVKDDYELHSIDLVSAPSYGNATKVSKANLIESGNRYFQDSASSALTEDEKAVILFERALEAGFRGSLNEYKTSVLKR